MLKLLAGLFGPKVRNVSPQEAYRLHFETEDPTVIVDVRQPLEHRSCMIPGATLIPLTEFGKRMAELPRERKILTICRSSHRSPIAARQLKKEGYEVLNVAGGMQAWKRAGLPLEER